MKICHLTAGDLDSGAAKGALGLHLSLLSMGVDSILISNDSNAINKYKSIVIVNSVFFSNNFMAKLYSFIDQCLTKFYPKRVRVIFSTGIIGYDFKQIKEYNEADIIHLHWINQGFFNISNFKKHNKIFFWTIRDMWPFTGGCHLAEAMNCSKYLTSCGSCIALGSSQEYDLSTLIQKRKEFYYNTNIYVVGISNWISNCAKASSLFNKNAVSTISNSIDTNKFKFNDKIKSKNKLQLQIDKKYVLVGAHDLKSKFKGFDIFIKAVQFCNSEFEILIFGDTVNVDLIPNRNMINYNKIYDDEFLNILYSAADVFVSCSLIESFGKTIAEAMSSGTPCVTFDCTGQKDIVKHKFNGYLSEPYCEKSIAQGIDWILLESDYYHLSLNARNTVEQNFSPEFIANSYIDLYSKALKY